MTTEHAHELYEEEFPLHCDECGDSFSALALIRQKNAEVEALQARVRELEGALAKAQIALHQVCVDEDNIGRVQPTTVNKVADARDRIAELRATLEGKD